MIKEKLIKMYRYRFSLLAGLILLMGIFMTVKNAAVLLEFGFYSKTLDELSVGSLRSGICIKDEVSYTYGNIGEWIGRKITKIYLVDIGSEHEQYAELLVKQNSYYDKDNDFDKLHTFSPGNYRELNSSNKVKMYAIVRKADKDTMFYDLFKNMFDSSSGGGKSRVSTNYQIYAVNPNDYKVDLITGVFFLITGIVLFVYIKKRQSPLEEEETILQGEEQEEIPKGLFSKGILEGREIVCVELVWQDGRKIFEEKNLIEEIMQNLDDVVMVQENGLECRKKECTYTFQLEDCTYINFEIWDSYTMKAIGGYYQISEEAYNRLIEIIRSGEEDETKL